MILTQTDKIVSMLKAMEEAEFYGVLVCKFERGKIVFIEETKKIKL